MNRLAIIVGFTIFLYGTHLAAQELPDISPEDLRQTFIETSAIPAIEAIISSLESQNAPVPPELLELLSLEDDSDSFYALAGKYLGYNWQERLSNDAGSLQDPDAALMVRTRLFLTSLRTNAGRIAKTSPLDESRIGALADNVMRHSRNIKNDEDRRAFLLEFEEAYAKIFPEEGNPDLDDFRKGVSSLLSDTVDAINILVDGSKVDKLSQELSGLQSRLQFVRGDQELTAWLAQFDSFAEKLLSHAIQADRVTVIKDIRVLLSNLVTYLSSLEENGVDGDNLLENAEYLLSLAEENVFNDEEFEELIFGTEELLTKISEPNIAQ